MTGLTGRELREELNELHQTEPEPPGTDHLLPLAVGLRPPPLEEVRQAGEVIDIRTFLTIPSHRLSTQNTISPATPTSNLQVFLQMLLVESRVEDGSFISSVVEEAGQDMAKCEVPSETIILPQTKEGFHHQLGQSENTS